MPESIHMKKTNGGMGMAQQAARRIRRSGGKKNSFLRGLLIAVGFTAAAVVIFALIIGMTDIPDGLIRIINQIIKIGAIFLGVRAIVSPGSPDGIRQGALLGLIYMGVGVLVYALLSGQKMNWLGYGIDILMGVAVGGLSGMLLSGRNK